MKTGTELEKEWTVSNASLKKTKPNKKKLRYPSIINFSETLKCNPIESKAWSKRLHGHDNVHDWPGESGVPALEEGARAD